MKTSDIEPGVTYVGKTGHPREVVRWAMMPHCLYYRTVFTGYKGPLTFAKVWDFAKWAISEHNEAAGGTAA